MKETNQSNEKNTASKGRGKALKILLVTIGVVAFIAVAIIGVTAAKVNINGIIFPNVYVEGISLEGKTADQALDILNRKYSPEKITGLSIPMTCKDISKDVSPESLELTFNNKETVANALEIGGNKNVISRAIIYLYQKISRTDVDLVYEYNREKLDDEISNIAGKYETAPVGTTFNIEPTKVVLHGSTDGIMVNRDLVAQEFENQIKSMSFTGITMEPVEVSPEPLDFDEFYKWLTSDAENAYYEKNSENKVVVHPDKLKCTVEKDVVKNALNSLETSAYNRAEFAVTTETAQETAALLQERLYVDNLGSYSTHYSGTAARNNNVQLSTGRIDGYEMLPGEEFSYDKTILSRTAANGYRAAPVYVGNKVESGMGGGICQPSSTLYCAALYANLEILERHNHSLMVGYMAPGLDATIAEGVLDLRFKNSTPYPIKISASASGGIVTFSIWGYNPEQYSVELLRTASGGAYHVTRIVRKAGKEVSREKMGSSRYGVKEEDKPRPTATPEATKAPSASQEPAAPQVTAPPTPSAPQPAAPDNTTTVPTQPAPVQPTQAAPATQAPPAAPPAEPVVAE